MKIINKLVRNSLKYNKNRTVGTIIGVILAVSLICTTANMYTSLKKTLLDEVIADGGNYHIKVSDVTENDLTIFKKYDEIEEVYESNNLGMTDFKNETVSYENIDVYGMFKKTFEGLSYQLTSGTFPKNDREILLPDEMLKKVNYKIGDKVSLSLEKQVFIDDYNIYEDNTYTDNVTPVRKNEYTIVGTIGRASDYWNQCVITGVSEHEQIDAYILLKSSRNYRKKTMKILKIDDEEDLKYSNGSKYQYSLNMNLLILEHLEPESNVLTLIMALVLVLMAIVLLTSMFCIRNSFSIRIQENIQMYGVLSSVGTTKKQIRKCAIREAMLLGIVGIPIGIILGISSVFLLVALVNKIGYGLVFYSKLKVGISIWAILISILLSIATLLVSASAPSIKASKMSPIDNLRNSNNIKINKKELKTPKLISKIFNVGGVIAYKNLKRNKKKYHTVVISITVGVFIFITLSGLVEIFQGMVNHYTYDYDFVIQLHFYEKPESYNEEVLKDVTTMKNVSHYHIVYRVSSLEIYDSEKLVNPRNDYIEVIALDDKSFKQYATNSNLNYNKVKDKGILYDINDTYDSVSDKNIITRNTSYDVGDIITGKKTIDIKNEIYEDSSYEVGGLSQIKPYGQEFMYGDSRILILNKKYAKVDGLREVTIKTTDPEKYKIALLKKYPELENSMEDRYQAIKTINSYAMIVGIFVYGLVSIITLIGITSIFNTITANMTLRQKEFAMLKSIGMTKKEFNKMIILETLFYSMKSLIIGIISGTLGAYGIFKLLEIVEINDATKFIPPMKSIIMSIIFVFIIVYIIMRYSINKVNEQNIIETIRKDNI